MDADDSQGLAWEITCTALAKTAAVEVVLDDEEKEAIEMEAHYKEFGGRKQIPGDPILWIQLTEGIYDPKMWRWMSDQGGYSITQRIKQGCQSFSERAAKQNIGVSKLLRDLAKSGQDKDGDGETDALALDPATLRAKAEAEQRAEDSKLEEIQRNHWDLFWRSFLDPRTQRPIYFNFLTGERRWTKPRGMSRIARRITQRRARQRKHSLIQIEDGKRRRSNGAVIIVTELFLSMYSSLIVFFIITAFKQTQTVLLTALNLFSLFYTYTNSFFL